MTAAPLDLFARCRTELAAGPEPRFVTVDDAWFLSLDGIGRPDDPRFREGLAALYTVARALRAQSKADGRPFVLPRLEGLYSLEPGYQDFDAAPPQAWQWTLCLRAPDFVGDNILWPLKEALLAGGKPPMVRRVKLIGFGEGRAAQALHVGPRHDTRAVREALAAFIEREGFAPSGRRHEIYLSDPLRTPPERQRTIVRYPVV
ncbi:hypothetical protein NNJEOMEG_01634 [Fundidesulfovibrio magnetotacticus]|uniref:GyrI-like small molecule binding domain-containing protein n=1 Tax=Fundidesulfovibrio magnetotacticus TaxID=2730080 RepID=A0A6V8LS51_9BACT|nr:GyrI-like domain-containing protein [Fundidesulfovibrio magnetotacticus]GFK93800.1 hypothetical protein NNJEOMEG_01634 [Fundidesulfovibrio magnetotacticus]